jgi:ABC-2 type transport system permease protein
VSGFLAIVRKEFRHVLRDPYSLVGTTVGTVLVMVLMSFAMSADIEHIPIAVYDASRTPQSRAYVQRFVNDAFFDVEAWARSDEEARRWVWTDRVKGAIIIPADFATRLQAGEPATVQVVADGTEPNIALQITGNVEALSTGYSIELLEERLARAGREVEGSAALLDFRVRTLYNPEQRELNTFLPGLMSIVLAFPALYAGLSLVREREQGSLEGLLSTPVRRYQLLAGKALPYLVIGLFDILVLTLVGQLLFDVPFRGSLFDLTVLSALFLLANIGVGLLVASLLRSQMATLIVGGLLFMLPLTQSGLITPLYSMSAEARIQALIWPATHYIIITRSIFLKGVGIAALTVHALFLLAAGLLLSGLAILIFRKKIA